MYQKISIMNILQALYNICTENNNYEDFTRTLQKMYQKWRLMNSSQELYNKCTKN